MPKLEITEEQLQVIQKALETYSRIGIGQFTFITEHPTFERFLTKKFKKEDGKTDWARYHSRMDTVKAALQHPRNLLIDDMDSMSVQGSWGIYHPDVDETCRIAYDIEKVIRHEKWKNNPDRSEITVDSYTYLKTKDSDKIKVEL